MVEGATRPPTSRWRVESCGCVASPLASGHGSGRSDTSSAARSGGHSATAETCRRALDAALNRTLHPTQRRLALALVVTVVCLPLLVLDQLGSHSSRAPEATMVDTGGSEPSMVVAVSPSLETSSTTSTSTPPITATPPTTAPTSTTAAPVTVPKKKKKAATTTTTTTAPKVVAPTPKAKAAPAPSTTAPPAPAPPPPVASGPTPTGWESTFLACLRHRESRGVYSAVDPSGQFMGAYQIYQGGWDSVAASIGRSDLVGVRPHTAAPADQDAVALAMLRAYGTGPWGGSCG